MRRSRGVSPDNSCRGGAGGGSGRSGGRALYSHYRQGHASLSSPPSQPGAADVNEYTQETLHSTPTMPLQGRVDSYSSFFRQHFSHHHHRHHQRRHHHHHHHQQQQHYREQMMPMTSMHHSRTEATMTDSGVVADSLHSKHSEATSTELPSTVVGECPHDTPKERNVMTLHRSGVSGSGSSPICSIDVMRGGESFLRRSLQSLSVPSPSGKQWARVLYNDRWPGDSSNSNSGNCQETCAEPCGLWEESGNVTVAALAPSATPQRMQQQPKQEAHAFLPKDGSFLTIELQCHQQSPYEPSEKSFSSPFYPKAAGVTNTTTPWRYSVARRDQYYNNNIFFDFGEASTSLVEAGAITSIPTTPLEDISVLQTTDNCEEEGKATKETACWKRERQKPQHHEQRHSEGDSSEGLYYYSSSSAQLGTTHSSDGVVVARPAQKQSSKESQRLEHETNMYLDEMDTKYLLSPQPECYAGRITCCVDLDNTLVYTFPRPPSWWDSENNPLHLEVEVGSSFEEKESGIERKNCGEDSTPKSLSASSSQYLDSDSGIHVVRPPPRERMRPHSRDRHYVCIRPYALEFVQFCLDKFELVFFTSGTEEYARPIFDRLEPKRVAHRFYRQHCTACGDGMYMKDLSMLGRPLDRVILFDDRGPDVSFQPDNVLFCEPFILEGVDDAYSLATKDNELCGYMEFLEMLTNLKRDVVLKAVQVYQEEVVKGTMMLLNDEMRAMESAAGAGVGVMVERESVAENDEVSCKEGEEVRE
ncbi:hypothetical protein TCDM_00434 [Trypanosoma cruzi Dm28c]|uniref:FCP1 homology domain-containing protein n=1 Tax=Trypanosoma cruzi Dm28c TaxID=1416333 RepID=V5C1N1_TRYCR|nr:hypothetical protein TCDM_00434 [Trypanosoma cruzi Dm28c]